MKLPDYERALVPPEKITDYPIRLKQAQPGAKPGSPRAAAKDWAGFVLSGLGK